MVGINQVLKICWEIVNKSRNIDNDNSNGQTMTVIDNKTVLQALALINDCNKYKWDLTTNGFVITDAIKFVQTNKEKLVLCLVKKRMIKNPRNLIMMKINTSWKKSRKRKQEKLQTKFSDAGKLEPLELAINPSEVGIQLILIVNYDSGQNTIIL